MAIPHAQIPKIARFIATLWHAIDRWCEKYLSANKEYQ